MIGEQEIHLYFKYKTSAVIEKFPHAWCKTDTSVLVSFLPAITIAITITITVTITITHAWCKTDTSVLVSFRPKWNLASEAGVSKDFRFTCTMTIATAMMIHI